MACEPLLVLDNGDTFCDPGRKIWPEMTFTGLALTSPQPPNSGRYVFDNGSIFTGFTESSDGMLTGDIRKKTGGLIREIKIHRDVLLAMSPGAMVFFMGCELDQAFGTHTFRGQANAA